MTVPWIMTGNDGVDGIMMVFSGADDVVGEVVVNGTPGLKSHGQKWWTGNFMFVF